MASLEERDLQSGINPHHQLMLLLIAISGRIKIPKR